MWISCVSNDVMLLIWIPFWGWVSCSVDQFPVVDGHELAGTVVKVGPGVSGLAVGDQVFGTQHKASHGAWADYTNVNAAYVSKVPDGFDMQQAGAAAAAIGTTLLAMDTAGM